MRLRGLILFALLLSGTVSFSQKLFEDKINVRAGKGTDMRDAVIYLPANYSKTKTYPLVIFSHGMGQAGKNVKKLYQQGLPKVLKKGYRPPFDFIMVAVQHNSFSIAPEWLAGILADSKKRWKIDASRIYLTGLSAGGWSAYGSQLNFNPAFAKNFAAIVINSGATQNTNKKNFDWWKETHTPLWAIVGAADKGFLGKNVYMVQEINKRVPNLATLTVRPGVGHGGWSDVYSGKVKLNGKNMWEWLYQYKRTPGADKPPVEEAPPGDDSTGNPDPTTSVKYIKVNISRGQNPGTDASWNNWNINARAASDLTAPKFKYDDGKGTAVSATLSNSHAVVDNGADYGSGMAPASVLRYASYAVSKRTLTITGLSTAKTYNLHLYASRRNRPGNTTIFKINQQTETITTNYNRTDKASFEKLKADAKGRIQVRIENGSTYNYLNGFMIVESPSGK